MPKQSHYQIVVDALKALSAEYQNRGIFKIWFTTQDVATRAGCSVATARKHLEKVTQYRGYSSRTIRGLKGYRFDKRWEDM